MYPPRWGPTYWLFLHALVELNRNSEGVSEWNESIWSAIEDCIHTIPCPPCRSEAMNYTLSHKYTNNPVEWVCNLHNYVNERNGKVAYTLEESNKMVISSLCGLADTNAPSTTKRGWNSGTIKLLVIFVALFPLAVYSQLNMRNT